MHLLTPFLTLLTLLTTLTTVHAASLKVVGQLSCSQRPTDVYLCFDDEHYAICKSDYGVTNIYEVPEGKEWCKYAKADYGGAFYSAVSTAFDGKGDSPMRTASVAVPAGPSPTALSPAAGKGGQAAGN